MLANPIRPALSLSASPAGALATPCTVRPSSFAARSRIGRAAGDVGTQSVPVPSLSPSAVCSAFSQYTSTLALSSRFTRMNWSLVRWLTRCPAGLGAPTMGAAGGVGGPGGWGERAVEAVVHAVVLHAHLHRQGPAGDVVRWNGRPAGVAEIVGIILWLEQGAHARAGRPDRFSAFPARG